MNRPTPTDVASAPDRRKVLVAEAMASLEDVTDLPVAEQLLRLDSVQSALSSTLNGGPVGQAGIPGVNQVR